LLETVKYLHSENVSICHRDINPNNVMVSEINVEGDLKVTLIDFNVSKRFREQEDSSKKLYMRSNTGAVAFIAPELHQQ